MKTLLSVLLGYCDHAWVQVVGVILPCLGYTALVVERIRLGHDASPAELRKLGNVVAIMWWLATIALLAIVVAVIRHLVARRWASAWAGAVRFFVLLLALLVVFIFLMPPMMFRSVGPGGTSLRRQNGTGLNGIKIAINR